MPVTIPAIAHSLPILPISHGISKKIPMIKSNPIMYRETIAKIARSFIYSLFFICWTMLVKGVHK